MTGTRGMNLATQRGDGLLVPMRPGVLVTALLAAALAAGGCKGTKAGGGRPAAPFPDAWSVVDLTRPLDGDAPFAAHPDGFPFERIPLTVPEGTDWNAGAYSALEQMGTHVAAPRARHGAGATVDLIPARDLLLPLAVVDVPSGTGAAPVTETTLAAHEAVHGPIPAGALVLLRTGGDGDGLHSGWSEGAIRFLANRGVRAVGTDARSIDPGPAAAAAPAQKAGSARGLWFVVNLRNLGRLPSRGAQGVVGALPIVGGTGAQARVLALVPPAPTPKTRDRAE